MRGQAIHVVVWRYWVCHCGGAAGWSVVRCDGWASPLLLWLMVIAVDRLPSVTGRCCSHHVRACNIHNHLWATSDRYHLVGLTPDVVEVSSWIGMSRPPVGHQTVRSVEPGALSPEP